ncbi:unnamed protein product [Cyprideis torosa]|uniref:non-specific serine/threonine protein kinase n=1 Tax=Cyprideis torosa TaxID=163714 RepID=A0A7R8W3N2_9CRUS|nr:unnamed protein product [Cyprideis torosa]CAG0881054.1 unnamed protein product [Cyprideis torosa]
MGNQLAGYAPAQIFPVETYMNGLTQLTYEGSLSSTRFLKVARARFRDGTMVVKVFVVHDPSLPLQSLKQRLEDIQVLLLDSKHCLPFQVIALTDKAAIFGRQYLRYTLCERLVTRPFLTWNEKLWLAYQVLKGLEELHQKGVCHGDLKTENCVISSTGWLCLTDIASFKPVLLPVDNPADFSYFFDTSGKRKCCIAPERFVSGLNSLSQTDATRKVIETLMPAMDIFSAGCVLAEIFSEGKEILDFAQLIQYCTTDELGHPAEFLKEYVPDSKAREVILRMLAKAPADRPTATELLESNFFPASFQTTVWPWACQELREAHAAYQLDDHILRLKELLYSETDTAKVLLSKDVVLIPLTFLCSCIRGLKFNISKSAALDLLALMASKTSPEMVTDRILAFVLHFLNEAHAPNIRGKAIITLCTLLENIPNASEDESTQAFIPAVGSSEPMHSLMSSKNSMPHPETRHLFPDLIFPVLGPLSSDPSVYVRSILGEHIGSFALTARRFTSFPSDLPWLVSWITEKVSILFSDQVPAVRISLVDHSLLKLCVFFGRQRASDVLLSHLNTFLNDKLSAPLRRAFYRAAVGLAVFTGVACASILKPLLLQGLRDAEESVTVEAINAACRLTEMKLLPKPILVQVLSETAPLLASPNPWIRRAIVRLLCTSNSEFTLVESQTWIVPLISPYLKAPLASLDDPLILLNSLDPTAVIPRRVWDALLRSPDMLQNDLQPRSWEGGNSGLDALITKCCGGGGKNTSLTARVKESVVALRDILLKIQHHRQTLSALQSSTPTTPTSDSNCSVEFACHGKLSVNPRFLHSLDLTHLKKQGTSSGNMASNGPGEDESRTLMGGGEAAGGYYRHNTSLMNMNQEWMSMFGGGIDGTKGFKKAMMLQELNRPMLTSSPPLALTPPVPRKASVELPALTIAPSAPSLQSAFVEYQCTPSRANLQAAVNARLREHEETAPFFSPLPPASAAGPSAAPTGAVEMDPSYSWPKVQGRLVCHSHPHTGPVTKLVALPGHMFASASRDGLVKIWDISRIEGAGITNRVLATHSMGASIVALSYVPALHSLCVGLQNGRVFLIGLDYSSHRTVGLCFPGTEPVAVIEGPLVDVVPIGRGYCLLLLNAWGQIKLCDVRAPLDRLPRTLTQDLKHGVPTALVQARTETWFSMGSSSGYISLWDLRFKLPVACIQHPARLRVRTLSLDPENESNLLAAFQGNNEVSLWSLESQARRLTFWFSSHPPLSWQQVTNHFTTSLFSPASTNCLFTAGTDMRIRLLNLRDPEYSICLSDLCPSSPQHQQHGGSSHQQRGSSYQKRIVDGSEVVVEYPISNGSSQEESHSLPLPPSGHNDVISSLVGVVSPHTCQPLLVSASFDGIVKVWK